MKQKSSLPYWLEKLAYSDSNASGADANLLAARENLQSRMKMSQMLMQNQNLRPRISLNQPLIHPIQECKILPLNHVLIQLNPRAQVFPCKKKICISSCRVWIRVCKFWLLRPLAAASKETAFLPDGTPLQQINFFRGCCGAASGTQRARAGFNWKKDYPE